MKVRIGRALAGSALIFIIASPALGRPTIIRELGTAPLLGPSDSTSTELSKILEHEALIRNAASKLGLTQMEFGAFLQQWRTHQMRWVEIPRHLDGMTWAAGDSVHVIKDVTIPSKTMGWEVDIPGPGRTLSLFLPAACGNLSLLTRPKRAVMAPPPKPLPTPPPVVETPAPPPPDAPAPEPSPQVAVVPPAVVAASKPFWPYLTPLVLLTFHTHQVTGTPTYPPIGPPPNFHSAA
ncbi:hypothetical protein EPN44_12310 [bacterium]|nr:MAG: hypothetical protein EPN44_12310 [bacterium]